ncbi:MAG: diguanylate cyclase [Desulfuromonadales bacterium]|jgi:two-component system, cell cycle response regulator
MTKPRIMIVDDEVFFRRLYKDILAAEDHYEIDTAGSGQEALDALALRGADLILTDLVMPGIDGLALLKRTRALSPAPDVILATGNATVETAIQALKSGARDYLLKPCNPDQLRHIVKSCLEQRRLLAENSLLQGQLRLYQRGQVLASQLHIETLFKVSLKTLMGEINTGRGLAYLANKNGVSQVSTIGFTDQEASQIAERLAVKTRTLSQATILQAVENIEIAAMPIDLRSLWVFPMATDSDTQGVLVLCNRAGENLPANLPISNLVFLAEQAALGFINACQFSGARELIYTDDLTGLYNHRYLHVALEQEIRRSERYGLEFSLAFIDLDLFKNINDEYGHLAGSAVLRQAGDILRECVRETDMLFRYGGDEFTALLVESGMHAAQKVAERIRAKIENYAFTTKPGHTQRMTATVGHATYPIHAKTKDQMIELADKAMYLGKHERNVARSASEVFGT